MTARLKDPRSQVDVTHDLASLICTCVLLSAQGWRDHDDADALRHDPAFWLAASSAAGLPHWGGGTCQKRIRGRGGPRQLSTEAAKRPRKRPSRASKLTGAPLGERFDEYLGISSSMSI